MQFRASGAVRGWAGLMVMEFQLEFAFFMDERGNEQTSADGDEHQSVRLLRPHLISSLLRYRAGCTFGAAATDTATGCVIALITRVMEWQHAKQKYDFFIWTFFNVPKKYNYYVCHFF